MVTAARGNWLTVLTGVTKPIIGMVHLPALPGTPLYDSAGGMSAIREWVRRDIDALQAGGIDAVMYCNENDRPYRLDADVASVAAMADVIASTRGELSVPFGVNVLWDPRATIAVANATGAAFVREIFTGAFAGDFGLWIRSAGDAHRYRREIGADDVRLIYNIAESDKVFVNDDANERLQMSLQRQEDVFQTVITRESLEYAFEIRPLDLKL